MLENIREAMMVRHHKKRDMVGQHDILICPRVKVKLEKGKIEARGWLAMCSAPFIFGVRHGAG